MTLSNYAADKINDHLLRNVSYTSPANVFLALFTVMPDADGAGGTEVVGGSYARQDVTFAASNDGVSVSSLPVQFTAMPACVVVGVALYDAATVGNMLVYYRYPSPVSVVAATDLPIPAGDIVEVTR